MVLFKERYYLLLQDYVEAKKGRFTTQAIEREEAEIPLEILDIFIGYGYPMDTLSLGYKVKEQVQEAKPTKQPHYGAFLVYNILMLRKTPLKRGNSQLKSTVFRSKLTATGFKTHKTINRVGKVGRANAEANKRIRLYLEANPIHHCELMFEDCLGNMYLQVAHKHPRAWYKGNVELLSDPNEYVIACQSCHEILDKRTDASKKLTEEVFARLRPC